MNSQNFELLLTLLIVSRFITVLISSRNEQKLKAIGAREYGKLTSTLLIIAHFGYYFACFLEGFKQGMKADTIRDIGLLLFAISIIALYYVIYELKHIWTVKLIIAPKQFHIINNSFLFRYVRHPNYYLNIIPELIAISLIFHAWLTLIIGLPIYLVILIIRIRQEEKIMRRVFKSY